MPFDDFYDGGYSDDEREPQRKINFDNIKCYGRDNELSKLHHLYAALCDNDNDHASTDSVVKAPVVVVTGNTGAGKSYFVHHFIEELKDRVNAGTRSPFLYLYGRYEERQVADPFYAVVRAFSGFFQQLLLDGQESDLHRIRRALRRHMGEDVRTLATLIPEIIQVAKLDELKQDLDGSMMFGETSWNRTLYAFQRLLSAISTKDHPLIFFLDDLQWSDPESTKLVRSLIQDSCVSNMFFIGSIRGEDVERIKSSHAFLDSLKGDESKIVEKINLKLLSQNDIANLVAEALELEAYQCQPLANILFEKTKGNAFFTVQLLEELERNQLIHFSVISFQWEWNLEEIENKCNLLSDNIDDAIMSKLQGAPRKLRQALIYASYTRSEFDVKTLKYVMEKDDDEYTYQELIKLLDSAVMEGFLSHNIGSSQYSFTHDRIQGAANAFVKAGMERDELRVAIGEQLYRLSQTRDGEDWMLFVASDHLNSCGMERNRPIQMATMNHLCGQKAVGVAAYAPASVYLRLALKALRKIRSYWVIQYDLSLGIHQTLCDVEYSLGNYASGDDLALAVEENARTLEDRLPTLFARALSKGKQQQFAEAYAILRSAMSQFNAIPDRHHWFHVVRDLLKVGKELRSRSDKDILNLPILEDPRKKTAVKFLAEVQVRTYYYIDKIEFMFCCLRVLRTTFKHGLSAASANSFAAYGIFLLKTRKDHAGAMRMAMLSRKIMERVGLGDSDSKRNGATALLSISFYIEAWNRPRDEIVTAGRFAYKTAMESGSVETAFLIGVIANNFAFAAGYPLVAVDNAGRDILQHLKLFNNESIVPTLLQIRLPILTLLGTSEKPLDWGAVEVFEATPESPTDLYPVIFAYLVRLELAVYFRKHNIAVRMSSALQPLIGSAAAYAIVAKNLFYSGLAYSGRARTGDSPSSDLAMAKNFSRQLRQYSTGKDSNVHHKCTLLDSGISSCLSRDIEKAASRYDKAIVSAIHAGYIQDAALASEVAGEFFLSRGDDARGTQYLTQAHDLYHEWGATGKCNDLLLHQTPYIHASNCGTQNYTPGVSARQIAASLQASRTSADKGFLNGPRPLSAVPALGNCSSVYTHDEEDHDISAAFLEKTDNDSADQELLDALHDMVGEQASKLDSANLGS
eukprot:Nitzschia sp. Nitz4//scaffold63_size106090//101717//105343//NITZ4_004418-RA/size106090-augustus-gene-0.169-mRNA-1//-1//CDS//3329556059//5508//frame0